MLQKSDLYYLGNQPLAPNQDLEVSDKDTREVATRVPLADPAAIDREGIRFAMEDMTEIRPLVVRTPA
jgi:hypothetical protein